jgi:hypothetical protein
LRELFSSVLGSLLDGLSDPEQVCIGAILTAALLLALLERAFPYNRGQKVFRDGLFDDLALYTIAQSYILGIVIFSAIIAP